jgi:hypothetical protein
MPQDTTLATLAREASDAFEQGTRPDGETFRRVRDGAPAWITDIIREAHAGMLPDDWKYDKAEDAFDAIADAGAETREDCDDLRHEFADGAVDVYTHDRLKWLASHLDRAGYVDQAASDGLTAPDTEIVDRIGIGQYVEAEEIFEAVLTGLVARLEAIQDADES